MLGGISEKNKVVNSVTCGGVPLTLVGESISNGNAHMYLYYLLNPASGTADVIVYLNANPDKGIVVGVTTFSNVNQNTPLGTFVSATSKNTTASVTVSTAAGELVYDVVTFRNATITVGSGQKPGVTIWPNPFTSSISVSITTTTETVIDISLIDISGQTLRKSSQSVPKGISKITTDGLEQLPAGFYLIEINDKKAGVTYQKIIKNNT